MTFLSERQRETAATAVTVLSVLLILLAASSALSAVARFFSAFSNVFLPLASAAVLALVLKPLFMVLRRRTGLPDWACVALVFLVLILPLAAVLFFFGSILLEQARSLAHEVPGWWAALRAWAGERLPAARELLDKLELRERLSQVLEQQGGAATAVRVFSSGLAEGGAGLFRILSGMLGWLVLPVYLFFFLKAPTLKRSEVESLLPFLKPATRADVIFLGEQFVQILVAFFRGQLVIALLQGLLFGTGFALCGLKYGFVLGLVLGFLNLVPYLGSMLGLAVTLPLALFQPGGGTGLLVLVVLVFVLVQVVEGYVLTPRIMGSRTGLHPLVIMVAVFFWGSALGGLAGMMLAIPLTAFLVVFWRLARDRYIKEIV